MSFASLLLLTLMIWMRKVCQVSLMKLLFFPFSILYSLEENHHVQPTIKESGIKLHLLESEAST